MKLHSIKTTLPESVVRELENFYAGMCERGPERRLRNMLVEYFKTESAREDEWVGLLMSDMYFYFELLDKCTDAWELEQKKPTKRRKNSN